MFVSGVSIAESNDQYNFLCFCGPVGHVHADHFLCERFRSRTPGPPPFSSINFVPAVSSASCRASIVRSFNSSPRLDLATVSTDTLAGARIRRCAIDADPQYHFSAERFRRAVVLLLAAVALPF
jgi:hypothetical protein